MLGLGFGCGPEKFVAVAKSMAGLEISLEESRRIVREYRETNPKVVELWRRLEQACRAKVGGDYVLPLPCTQWDRSLGRYLIYRDVHVAAPPSPRLGSSPRGYARTRRRDMDLRCTVGGDVCSVYGGLLAENFTQATARDVLGFAWLRCAEAGFLPVLSVHDELVFELPVASAEEDLARIVGIMEQPVPWALTLPLKAEGELMEFYRK